MATKTEEPKAAPKVVVEPKVDAKAEEARKEAAKEAAARDTMSMELGGSAQLPSTPAIPSDATEEIEFEDPDFSKPIYDITNLHGEAATVIVIEGNNLATKQAKPKDGEEAVGDLIFVRSGITSELLTQGESLRKFVQDVDGRIYYSSKGFMVSKPTYKPVDIIGELG
jgi:hypothetical protein